MTAAADPTAWQRLHPLSAVVRLGRAAIALLAVVASALVNPADRSALYTRLGLLVVVGVAGVVSWLVTRWRIADGALQVETGLVRRRSLRYPLDALQAVDVVRPGVARALGLSELRLRMASGGSASGRLAYLPAAEAEALRTRLLALSRSAAAPTAAVAPAPMVVHRVDTGRLVGSLALSGPVAVLVVVLAGLAALSTVAPAATAGSAGAAFALLVSIGTALWQRFNAAYGTTVTQTVEGLVVEAGLVARSAETIPAGRVQALRMVQPLTWRPLGWCRLEVDVAGRVTTSRRSRSERRAGRTLLPVGTPADAYRLVAGVTGRSGLTGGPPTPPPTRARWKAPLRFHHLTFGADSALAFTTSGRLRVVSDWVPLARLQSVRKVDGPLQRRLGLASVHLDTAGRSVHAVARDRDAAEADRLLGWLAAAAGSARRAGTPER